jgi:FemAB-related protein (PEP-CTERM system-associated)
MREPKSVATGSVCVRPYQASDKARWDEFVARCSNATFFHLAGWERVIAQGLGHRCHYLLAERNGEIEGVLPLAETKSWLFGHSLVSTPCCVYGGVAAVSTDAGDALLGEAVSLARQLKVGLFEARHRERLRPDWPEKSLYATFRKRISANVEQNLKEIPRKQRAMVRKGVAAGLMSRVTSDVDRLFRLYAESVRNLGTPVFPRRYFKLLLEEFGDSTELSIVLDGRSDVAGVLSFYFRNEVLPYYGGSRPAGRALKANDFMYWDLMCRAAERGVEVFDYGRSKVGSGSFQFKQNWGFLPEPLHYECHLVRAKRIPEVNPGNPKYRRFIAVWKRLPLFAANRFGPMLARHLG